MPAAVSTRLSPAHYARIKLGLTLYDWQQEALQAIGLGLPVSLCAANGSGKTSKVIAASILWALDSFLRATVVVTSGSWMQVEEQLFPALHSFRHFYPTWKFNETEIHTPTRGRCIGFSTNEPGRAEGWHGKDPHEEPLYYIVDEAKSVPDGIFEAVSRCTRHYQLFCSSAGANRGKFYRTHHKESSLFYPQRITSMDCPHIPARKREADLKMYGANHPTYRSMHLSEFTEEIGQSIITPDMWQACLNEPPRFLEGPLVAFCDFAAGGDENVLAVRTGNRVWIEDAWLEKDTVQAVRRFIAHFRRIGITSYSAFVDGGGIGIPMACQFRDEGFPVQAVNNGADPKDQRYANLGTEIWFTGRRLVEQKAVILPNDPVLQDQVVNRRWLEKAKGKLAAESKEDMRRRGVHSPDRADAVFGVMACGPHLPQADAMSSFSKEDIILPSTALRPQFVARRF